MIEQHALLRYSTQRSAQSIKNFFFNLNATQTGWHQKHAHGGAAIERRNLAAQNTQWLHILEQLARYFGTTFFPIGHSIVDNAACDLASGRLMCTGIRHSLRIDDFD